MLWTAFYPYVLPEVTGVPEPLLQHFIRLAAIHFFEEAQVWTVDVTPINLVALTGTYNLVAPAQTITAVPLLTEVPDVAMAKWAWVNGVQIFPASQEELGALSEYWADKTSSFVSNYTQHTQDTITLFPIPDFASTAGLKVKVAVRPSLTSTGVPDWLGSKYVQEISCGAKSDLMGMIGKPWSNPDGEAKYGSLYEKMLTKATVEGNRSFTRTTSTVRFPRYG